MAKRSQGNSHLVRGVQDHHLSVYVDQLHRGPRRNVQNQSSVQFHLPDRARDFIAVDLPAIGLFSTDMADKIEKERP